MRILKNKNMILEYSADKKEMFAEDLTNKPKDPNFTAFVINDNNKNLKKAWDGLVKIWGNKHYKLSEIYNILYNILDKKF